MAGLQASRTAVLVCQARALAHGRLAQGRFSDPVARRLLRPEECAEVDMACGPVPDGPERALYEFRWTAAAVMATRTVAIDDVLGSRPDAQVVVLGAGLDARAWRMPQLGETVVFEVDQPASQADKQARAEGLVPAARRVAFVPVEFGRDGLLSSLELAGYDPQIPTTWILEGVLDYLTGAQAHATFSGVCGASSPGSRLAATYTVRRDAGADHPGHKMDLGATFTAAGRPDPLEHETLISAWTAEQMHAVLGAHGMAVVSDLEHLVIAAELGLDDPRSHDLQAICHVVVADVGNGS